MPPTVSKTFRLTHEAVNSMQELVRAGRAQTQTALLESLIAREKARLTMEREERELDEAWQKAMSNPEYRAELAGTESAFAAADAESARMIH